MAKYSSDQNKWPSVTHKNWFVESWQSITKHVDTKDKRKASLGIARGLTTAPKVQSEQRLSNRGFDWLGKMLFAVDRSRSTNTQQYTCINMISSQSITEPVAHHPDINQVSRDNLNKYKQRQIPSMHLILSFIVPLSSNVFFSISLCLFCVLISLLAAGPLEAGSHSCSLPWADPESDKAHEKYPSRCRKWSKTNHWKQILVQVRCFWSPCKK